MKDKKPRTGPFPEAPPGGFWDPINKRYTDYLTYYDPTTGEIKPATNGAFYNKATGEFSDIPYDSNGKYFTPYTPPPPPPPPEHADEVKEKPEPPPPPKAEELDKVYKCNGCGAGFSWIVPRKCSFCGKDLTNLCWTCGIRYPLHCPRCPCCKSEPRWKPDLITPPAPPPPRPLPNYPQVNQVKEVPFPYYNPANSVKHEPVNPPKAVTPLKPLPAAKPRKPRKARGIFITLLTAAIIGTGIYVNFGSGNSPAGEWVREEYAHDYKSAYDYFHFTRSKTYYMGGTPETAIERDCYQRNVGVGYLPYVVEGNVLKLMGSYDPNNDYSIDYEFEIKDGKLYLTDKGAHFGNSAGRISVYVKYNGVGWGKVKKEEARY